MEKKLKKKSLINRKTKTPVKPPKMEMLMVVVKRGKGDDVADFLKTMKVDLNIVSFGSGTATSAIADLFGLDNREKEVVFAVIKHDDSNLILDSLEEKFLTVEKYAGIAMTIPLKSITNQSLEQIVEGGNN